MGQSREFKSQDKAGGSRLGQGKVSDWEVGLTPVKGEKGRSITGQGKLQLCCRPNHLVYIQQIYGSNSGKKRHSTRTPSPTTSASESMLSWS